MHVEKSQSTVGSPVGAATAITTIPVTFLTVTQLAAKHSAFTENAVRALIFAANTRESTEGVIPGNGLIESGALVRLGRKVLINETQFFKWVTDQQQNPEHESARHREALRSIKRRSSSTSSPNLNQGGHGRSGAVTPRKSKVKGDAGSSGCQINGGRVT